MQFPAIVTLCHEILPPVVEVQLVIELPVSFSWSENNNLNASADQHVHQ